MTILNFAFNNYCLDDYSTDTEYNILENLASKNFSFSPTFLHLNRIAETNYKITRL